MVYGRTTSSKITFCVETVSSDKGEVISEFIQKTIEESSVHSCFTITVNNIAAVFKDIATNITVKTTKNIRKIKTFWEAKKLTSSIPVSFDEVSIRNVSMNSFETRRNSGRFRLPFAPMRRSISMSKNEDLPSNHPCVADGNATRHGITYQMVEKEKSHGTKRKLPRLFH